MRGYRAPYRQQRRWEALSARPCPSGCPHPSGSHREYQSTWERGEDGPVEVKHPRYRPLLFRCDLCPCEIDASSTATSSRPSPPAAGNGGRR